MDKIKKITTYSIALAVLVFLTFTLYMTSYLFDKEKVENEFTVGIQSSHIEEEFGPYDKFEEGQSYIKKVSVINDRHSSLLYKGICRGGGSGYKR